MRFLVAPDKFKHSLTATEAGTAIAEGLRVAFPESIIEVTPLSDGGEGWLDGFCSHPQVRRVSVDVHDPLFRKVKSEYMTLDDGRTAIIEMAKASGLQLLKPWEYNCAITSSYGTGELMRAAIENGATEIVLGIGGSASNDGGIGMLHALGFRFLDKGGRDLKPIGENLIKIKDIDTRSNIAASIQLQVACDVKNPLTGINGATHTYASQKGADSDLIDLLEKGMNNYEKILNRICGEDISKTEGSGAAGGVGAACLAFLNARMVSGISLFLKTNKVEQKVAQADVVFTGEGKLDWQSLQGKAVAGICDLARKHGKPTIALCGMLELDESAWRKLGLTLAVSISDGQTKEYSLDNAALLLREKATEVACSLKS